MRLFAWRKLLFRLGAVFVGLACVGVLEIVLVLSGVGGEDYEHDPFVGFDAIHPLFEHDPATDRYQIASSRLEFFRPDSFSAQKGVDEFRVFCLGGSTVQGRPYAIETSFATWLELSLQAADPGKTWQVVNCGGISYASYRLVPVLQEVLGYDADLIVVYTGHNEFLEDRTYGHIRSRSGWLGRGYGYASRLRIFRLLHAGWLRVRGNEDSQTADDLARLPSEVEALLDYRGGLEHYHHDPAWREDVISHFRYNIRRMVHLARQAGVPLVLANPACNVRDCPPLKSEHRGDLTAEELRRWETLCTSARQHLPANKLLAIDLFRQALKIDDQYAGLHYTLAKCYDDLGMLDEAYAAYGRARELDVCPLRILEPMHESLLEISRQTGTPIIDTRELIRDRSRDGIPGGDWLIDHVHPTIRGHQIIAEALVEQLVQQEIAKPQPNWQTRRDALYQAHIASLDEFYFLRAEERLRALRGWAEGRAERLPGSTARETSP